MNDRLPFHDLLDNIQATMRRAGCLAFVALIIGVFVPGYIQYKRNTFFREDIIEKIKDKDIREAIYTFELRKQELKMSLDKIDKSIIDAARLNHSDSIVKLIDAYDQVFRHINQRQEPYHISPVYLDPLIIVWIFFYISFIWLIILFSPKIKHSFFELENILFFLGLWFFYRAPTWLRNSQPFRYKERKVYAGTNIDVDIPSFILQEFQAGLVCILIMLVLLKWTEYFMYWRNELKTDIKKNHHNLFGDLCTAFHRQFIHWQICSILIAIAFIPYTYFFWKYVIVLGDVRYIYHALVVHVLWGVVWLTISAPVFYTWYRLRALIFITSSNGCAEQEGKELDIKHDPEHFEGVIGSFNFIGSILAACITFVAPILKSSIFG